MAQTANQVAVWLPAARTGSLEALGQLLEACRGYLLMIAQQELDPALRAKEGASDLVQQTLVEAVRDFGGFRGDSEADLLHWLRRLLLNNLTDFTREYRDTAKRRIDREVRLAAGDSSADRDGGLPGSALSPSGEAMAREQAEAIHGILARLPDDYRRVLLLRFQEGRGYDEIGRMLDLTANAARKLLVRAVRRVRQELDESQ